MKITTLTRLMAALALLTAAPLTAQAAFNQILYTANYTGTPVLGTDTLGGVTYATVGYGDLYNDGQPGMPYLPVDYLRFSVPYNATNFTVTASCPVMYKTTRNLSHLVYPSQPPRLMNDTTPVVITLPDSTAYSTGGSYPMQPAWVVDEGFLDGENHIVTVAVMPFVYKRTSTSDKLEQWKRVNVKLQYDLSDSLAMYPIVRNDSTMREDGYNLARSIVVNPGQVKTFAPVDISNDFDSLGINLYGATGDGLNGGGYGGSTPVLPPLDSLEVDTTGLHTGVMYMNDIKYLIVTTADLYHSLRRLAALKRQEGYTVAVVTMDQVIHDPDACLGDRIRQTDGNYKIAYNDEAGILREFLKKCYKKYGTKFVLLAGCNVPYRSSVMMPRNDTDSISLQSDLYYSDLNGDWSVDTIDLQPEIFVGRLIAKSQLQIDNYTDKLFRYVFNPGGGFCDYLLRGFYSESYDMRKRHEVDSVKSVFDSIFPNSFVMQESDQKDDKSKYPSGRDIINELNTNQYGFLSLHHHGYPSGLITYGLRGDYKPKSVHADKYRFLWAVDSIHIAQTNYVNDDTLKSNGLNNLANKRFPSICYSIACSTIPFDVWPFYDELTMNFGESFTTGKDYGGPIFIGNTHNGFTPTSALLEKSFGIEILNGYHHIAIANSFAKRSFYTYRKQLTEYVVAVQNLLGDPSLELWTDIPESYTNVTISRMNNSVIISGIDVDSTYVIHCCNNGTLKKTLARSSNITLTNVSPNGMIMLYKHNKLPYLAPIHIQNLTINKSQYLIASDVMAGSSIDANRNYGNVIVTSAIEYEIESLGTVTLEDGFIVEKGATFAVYPSSF